VAIFWTHFTTNTPQCKCHVNPFSGFRVPWDRQIEGEIERKADGWTDMEMQTVTFAILQTLLIIRRYRKCTEGIINIKFHCSCY